MILGDNTYYVSSPTANDCPQPCHPLSYYIANTATYFTSNATFIFMEGEHLLDSKGSVQVVINDVENLTLRGERGYSNIDNIVRCGNNTHGLVFNNGNIINIYDITITGCGPQPSLQLTNIASLYIYHIVLYNNYYIYKNTSNYRGILYINSGIDARNNITIANSEIITNEVCGDGGVLIIVTDTGTHNNITITNTTLADNIVGGIGGGLFIYTGTNTHNSITITNSTFINNTVYGESGVLMYVVNTENITHNNSAITDMGANRGGLFIRTGTDTHNNIAIIDSTFTDNAIGGNGSGLLIGTSNVTHNNISITNSAFTNNKVSDWGSGLYIDTYDNTLNNITVTNSAFTNNTVGGDGGGLYINTNFTTYNNITIANSAFTYNKVAGHNGGGLVTVSNLYTLNNITITNSVFNNNIFYNHDGSGLNIYSNFYSQNNVVIINTAVINNTAFNKGGGLFIDFIDTRIDAYNNVTIINSTIANNTVGDSGGGLFIGIIGSRTHNNIIITNITVTNNTIHNGGGLYVTSGTYMHNNSHVYNVTITNSTFTSNIGPGIIALSHITVVFTEGHSIVANNSSPTDGGGIFLGKDCYLTTSNGGHVSFINNTAQRYGGAIYSLDDEYTSLRHMGNVIDQFYLYQCTVYNLLGTFVNNSATMAGDQLYGGVLTLCNNYLWHWDQSKNSFLQDLIQCAKVPYNMTKNSTSLHPLSPVSSDPLVVCPCVNGTVDCNGTSLDREVYPGRILNVSLVTVGLCGGVSPGTVIVKHDKHINLLSSDTTDYTSTSCTTLNYTIQLITDIVSSTMVTLNTADGDIYNIRPISVNLTILPCPIGLVVSFILGDCVCNNDITRVPGVLCNTSWMPRPIQRSGSNWLHQHDEYNCTVAHTGCPFDYCNTSSVKLALNDSDLQCNYNRSGILCGQCQTGLSLMIGSNRCANCTDTTLVSVSIFIIAAVAGVVLVIILMTLNLTVSVGSINGLLFYVNLVKLNESVFFSRENIPVISQFISLCNLDIGFEYCFVDGLDGYVKTWLQFVFPLYVWFLIVVIIVGCRYSGRLSRLCGRNAVPVLATLILMSYTKLSRTVTNALMMNALQCGEHKWNVWNVDGNIDYFSGKHTVLFTVSMLFLIAGLVYTGLVFSSQWLQRYSGKCCRSTRDPVVKLKPLIDAYTGPFKDKYRFWTGLCLIVRLMLTVVFSFTTTLQSKLNNYIILLIVNAMIIFIAVSGKVYKDKRLSVLEMFSYVNMICLCVMTVLFTDDSYSRVMSVDVIVSVSVSIEILLFVIIVTVHCYLAIKMVFPNCRLYCCRTYQYRYQRGHSQLHLNTEPRKGKCHEFIESPVNDRVGEIFDIYLDEDICN